MSLYSYVWFLFDNQGLHKTAINQGVVRISFDVENSILEDCMEEYIFQEFANVPHAHENSHAEKYKEADVSDKTIFWKLLVKKKNVVLTAQ